MKDCIWTFLYLKSKYKKQKQKTLKIVISLNMDLNLLISTTVTLFCIDIVKIGINFFVTLNSYFPFQTLH